MKSHVIKVKGNYLLLYLWCSHSLISQGITHPSIYPPVLSSMHRPLYSLSVLPSISCHTKPPIRPPTVSTQVSRWAYYFFSRKQNHRQPLLPSLTQRFKPWQHHQRGGGVWTLPGCWRRKRRSANKGQGGSKCQVPLGSDDGGYIYQSKQPRGAEYFTCRCGLLHYHIHQSHGVPF